MWVVNGVDTAIGEGCWWARWVETDIFASKNWIVITSVILSLCFGKLYLVITTVYMRIYFADLPIVSTAVSICVCVFVSVRVCKCVTFLDKHILPIS